MAQDDDSPPALLSKSQRNFLRSNIENTDGAKQKRYRIRKRVRQAFRDFRLLATQLGDNQRDKIFPDPDIEGYEAGYEYRKTQRDISHAIAFMYAGLGGESGFRQPLSKGVRNGEKALGLIEHPLHVEPRFTVDFLSHVDLREAIEIAERGEWDRLSDRSLLAVIKLARNVEAIDFEAMYEALDQHEEAQELLEEHEDSNELLEALRSDLDQE